MAIPLNQAESPNHYNYEDDYQTSLTSQADQDGRRILCIHIQPLKGKKKRKPMMSGDLYVEADSLRPIGFEGKIEGLKLESSLDGEQQTAKATIDIHIAYSHAQGYNRVASISTRLRCRGIDCHTIAYNVDNPNITDDTSSNRSPNLITAIQHTRKDAAWWQKNIIQPTEAEKRLLEENGITLPHIQTTSTKSTKP